MNCFRLVPKNIENSTQSDQLQCLLHIYTEFDGILFNGQWIGKQGIGDS